MQYSHVFFLDNSLNTLIMFFLYFLTKAHRTYSHFNSLCITLHSINSIKHIKLFNIEWWHKTRHVFQFLYQSPWQLQLKRTGKMKMWNLKSLTWYALLAGISGITTTAWCAPFVANVLVTGLAVLLVADLIETLACEWCFFCCSY